MSEKNESLELLKITLLGTDEKDIRAGFGISIFSSNPVFVVALTEMLGGVMEKDPVIKCLIEGAYFNHCQRIALKGTPDEIKSDIHVVNLSDAERKIKDLLSDD